MPGGRMAKRRPSPNILPARAALSAWTKRDRCFTENQNVTIEYRSLAEAKMTFQLWPPIGSTQRERNCRDRKFSSSGKASHLDYSNRLHFRGRAGQSGLDQD